MSAPEIPKNIIVAIEKRWPDGVVEKFDQTQSYFEPIRARLEQDLHAQAKAAPDATAEWQSFHEFFLAGHTVAVSKAAPFAVLNVTDEKLRRQIAAVLKKYRIVLLDPSILDLPVDGLSVGEAVLLEEPVRVVDAFFFRAA
jgi:hypothetical protein